MRSFIIAVFALILIVCGGQKAPAPKVTQPSAAPETSTFAPVESAKPATAEVKTESVETKSPPARTQKEEKQPVQLPKLWDFFATWCPPCKQQAPIIEELAAEYSGQIEIISIDTDKNPELARKFNIQAIPTLVFLDPSGKELSRRVGFFPKDSILARFKAHGFIK
ncbi:MAG: thioredoxin domain-containing protein [candidate division WOR-3 bacterium]